MLTEDSNDDQQGRARTPLRTVAILTASTLSVSACVGASALWPHTGGVIGAAITGVALVLQIHGATRD